MHIFLIEIRGCHLGYLGCYGNDWLSTPALNAIASAGIVFDSHYADRVGQTQAQPAWSTVNAKARSMSLEPLLADRGVEVRWAGTWPGRADRPVEMSRLLRNFAARTRSALVPIGITILLPPWEFPPTGEELYTETEPEDPDAEAHILNEPDAHTLAMRQAYGSRIEAVDEWVAQFMEELHDKKLLDRCAIIVTADQGVSLGEHATEGTMPAHPYEEIGHLPLIIRLPGADSAGCRVQSLMQASDLPGIVLGLLDGRYTAGAGKELLIFGHDQKSAREFARTVQIGEAGPQSVAIRTAEWAFLTQLNTDSPISELYRKPDDRWEINNVIQHYSDLVPTFENMARTVPAT